MTKENVAPDLLDLTAGIANIMQAVFPPELSVPTIAVIAVFVIAATRAGRVLQNAIEWGQGHQQSLIGRLSAIGATIDAPHEYGRQVHRTSIGVRAVLAFATISVLTSFYSIQTTQLPAVLQPYHDEVFFLAAVLLFYANVQIWTFEIAIEAQVISIPNWTLCVQDYRLDELSSVEKKGSAQIVLTFSDGRRARIMTHVAGSRALLHTLQDAVDRNMRG